MIQLCQTGPDVEAEATQGRSRFHEWFGDCPPSTGPNFDEILRVTDRLQITDRAKVATPVNWRPGERGIIPPSIPDEQARTLFPQGWEAKKPYLRYVEVQ
jgi:hypothetical protein